ncbi:hypothetical protein [Archangium sp.]|jgi:hypothetical protein|uniref:hypothetical protein n=1 Tax=Archangium sp. TaxID=1872627 RepID=UPI002ED9AD6B
MADSKNWGNCKGCRHFGSHHPDPGDTAVAKCMEPDLQAFELQVTGASGCNEFEARTAVSSDVYDTGSVPSMH